MAPPRSRGVNTTTSTASGGGGGDNRATSPVAQRTQALANYKKTLEMQQYNAEKKKATSTGGQPVSSSAPEWMTENLLSIQERQLLRQQKKKQSEVFRYCRQLLNLFYIIENELKYMRIYT